MDDQFGLPGQGTMQMGLRLMAAIAGNPAGRLIGGDGQVISHADMPQAVATWQRRYGDLPDGAIAICAAKSPHVIAALLGTLAAGRPYAPLDPSHPDERLTMILEMLAPAALVVDDPTALRIGPWARARGITLLHLDGTITPAEAARAAPPPEGASAVLHTSGSTGQPKQVRIAAAALHAFALWVRDEFGVGPDDCLLSHAPLAFDLSFLDVLSGLDAGASVALADTDCARNGERLLRLIEDAGVTFLHGAPSAFALMMGAAEGRSFPAIRAVLFAGEPMPAPVLQQIFVAFPNARVVNIYGCTETNDTFFYDVPRTGTPDPLPLGRPLPYVDYLIVDEYGAPVPAGHEGELWLDCPTLMQGYSEPKLNSAAFAEWQGRRWFRSRDRVRMDDEGLLHFLGRADSVQKINGHRVDLTEVETCLAAIDGLRELAVFVALRDGTRQLECAAQTDGRQIRPLDLRMHAMRVLPPAAIPRRFALSADPLPKNSNGKICRRTLAAC